MDYITTFLLTKTNAVINASCRFRLNSIYDPDLTNLGKNVKYSGYTQAAALYTYYKVISNHFTVELQNGTSTCFPVVIAFQDDASSTVATDLVTDIASRYRGQIRLCPPTSDRKLVFDSTMDIRSFWGIPEFAFDDNYSALMSDNPARSVALVIALGEVSDVASTQLTASVLVHLRAEVDVYAPIEVLGST